MKKIATLILLALSLSLVVHAEESGVVVGEEGAKMSSDGKTVFPKEIENCEPCKQKWLAAQGKRGANKAAEFGSIKEPTGKKAQVMDVKTP